MLVSKQDYQEFQRLLQSTTGILLGDDKEYLVASRLGQFLKEHNLSDFNALLQALRSPLNSSLSQGVIDRMTTNETLWFRDQFPFEYLIQSILPELKRNGSRQVRIWCAACSSGQEPYSISMALDEANTIQSTNLPAQVDLLATDISSRVLEQAKQGRYQAIEISRGLSVERQSRHFTKHADGSFEVKPHLKTRIRYSPLNLLKMPYTQMGSLDVVFCRNVLIYFSAELKQRVIQSMADLIKPGGYLFLGASESMPHAVGNFEMVRCNPGLVYRKRS